MWIDDWVPVVSLIEYADRIEVRMIVPYQENYKKNETRSKVFTHNGSVPLIVKIRLQ